MKLGHVRRPTAEHQPLDPGRVVGAACPWLVTAWSTLEPQPDQAKDPEAWARFVSSDAYQFSHLFGSTAGVILAVFGFFALGCSMANSRTGRLALASMVTAVAGTALLLVPAVISTFGRRRWVDRLERIPAGHGTAWTGSGDSRKSVFIG
ncbi:hypothetical protein ACVWY0_002891 [Arthrobacter sp. UYNi723]